MTIAAGLVALKFDGDHLALYFFDNTLVGHALLL
jgi:hypothetical protein